MPEKEYLKSIYIHTSFFMTSLPISYFVLLGGHQYFAYCDGDGVAIWSIYMIHCTRFFER